MVNTLIKNNKKTLIGTINSKISSIISSICYTVIVLLWTACISSADQQSYQVFYPGFSYGSL